MQHESFKTYQTAFCKTTKFSSDPSRQLVTPEADNSPFGEIPRRPLTSLTPPLMDGEEARKIKN